MVPGSQCSDTSLHDGGCRGSSCVRAGCCDHGVSVAVGGVSAHRGGGPRSPRRKGAPPGRRVPPFVAVRLDFRGVPGPRAGRLRSGHVRAAQRLGPGSWCRRRCWHRSIRPQPDTVGPRTGRDWAVDVVGFLLAAALGGLFLRGGTVTTGPSRWPTPQHRRRRRLRVAGLPVVVVAATLAARRRAGLCPAGGVLDVRHRRRAARAVLPRRAPQRPAGAACRRAVDPDIPGLRGLQPDGPTHCRWSWSPSRSCSRPPRGACSSGPDVSSSSRCASVPCARRPTSGCTPTAPGWPSGPGSRARCTTCSPTGSH